MLRSHKKSRKTVFITLILFVVGILLSVFVGRWIYQYRMAIPIVHSEIVEGVFHTKHSLIKEILRLRFELTAQEARTAELNALKAENIFLKEQYGRVLKENKGVLARVVSTSGISLYDTLTLDAGSGDGVQVGQTVYAFDTVALGTISEVTEKNATVLLFSAPGREYFATLSDTNTTVTLVGRGAGEYEVRLPRDVYVAEGTVITEQSISAVPVAVVQKVVSDARDPFQKLLAKMPVNILTISWAIVR